MERITSIISEVMSYLNIRIFQNYKIVKSCWNVNAARLFITKGCHCRQPPFFMANLKIIGLPVPMRRMHGLCIRPKTVQTGWCC